MSLHTIKASSMIEALVSVAIISAMILIIFPFFGQVLKSNHRLELMHGLHLILLHENDSLNSENEEFSEEGITIIRKKEAHSEIPDLYFLTTEIVNSNKKVIYNITVLKYYPGAIE